MNKLLQGSLRKKCLDLRASKENNATTVSKFPGKELQERQIVDGQMKNTERIECLPKS